ncbi:MAG: amine oxidoreductase, partial [Pseudomonadota bacterium]
VVSASGERSGPYEWVTTATPAVQAAALLPHSFSHHQALSETKMDACFTLMCGFDNLEDPGFDGAFVEDDVIGWISVNSSKPGRQSNPSIVVQSRNDWADANTEMPREEVQEILEARAAQLTGIELARAPHRGLHRWLYASTSKPADQPFLLDGENRLAAIGDWCIRGRVEAAFESATAFAAELETRL